MLNFRTILPSLWEGIQRISLATRLFVVPVLALASLPYRFVVGTRNMLYDQGLLRHVQLPRPVVSIGNITVGGTGKTPLTILVAILLREKGCRPAVLSRGYGGTGKPMCVVSDGNRILATAAIAGDEPLLIARSLRDIPVITGADRVRTGTYAIQELAADVLILDDAFQHRRLFRDLNIALLRKRNPFGNGHVLPLGPLRESLSALQRADILVFTDSIDETNHPSVQAGLPPVPHFRARYLPTALLPGGREPGESPAALQGKKICAFAGIANPESFLETLEALGGTIVAFHAFPDHHPYTAMDITEIQKSCADSCADITVTTEKDGMRLAGNPSFLQGLFLLRVELDILPSRHEFAELILKKLKLTSP